MASSCSSIALYTRKARGSYRGSLMLDAAASVKSPRRVCISECLAVCTNFCAGSLRIIFRSRAEGAWQGSRRKAPERGGVRLPRQAEAGGTSHRHPVSGPRGCRALPPHFPRCSLGAFRLSDSSSPPSAEPFDVVESGPLRLTMLKKSLNPEP